MANHGRARNLTQYAAEAELTMSEATIVPIIGGGPAGMSCALWLHNYGLRPVLIEKEAALGGMARLSPYPNEWLLGRAGETARENADAFARHIRRTTVETWLGARPQRVWRERRGPVRARDRTLRCRKPCNRYRRRRS